MDVLEVIENTEIDVITSLNNTNIYAKEEFLSDESLTKPNNEYGNMNIEKIRENVILLSDKLKQESRNNSMDAERQILKQMLQFNLKKNQFILANGQYLRSEKDKQKYGWEHGQSNIALYGKPDLSVFCGILKEKLSKIEPDRLSGRQHIQYKELCNWLNGQPVQNFSVYRPPSRVFIRFSEIVNDFMEYIFRHIPSDMEIFTPADACEIANLILKEELSEVADGWHAVVEPNASYASVSTLERRIYFPGKRTKGNYSLSDLKAILVHELGVHAFRSMIYGKHHIAFLSRGLPGYEVFEEGLAKACEQAVIHCFLPSGYMHYISIGLAFFLKKSFREVFEIQVLLESTECGEPVGRCFDSVQRAFRGTGELVNSKDLVYYNGAFQAWKYVEDHLNDFELMDHLFLCGKTDITDHKQEALLYQVRK